MLAWYFFASLLSLPALATARTLLLNGDSSSQCSVGVPQCCTETQTVSHLLRLTILMSDDDIYHRSLGTREYKSSKSPVCLSLLVATSRWYFLFKANCIDIIAENTCTTQPVCCTNKSSVSAFVQRETIVWTLWIERHCCVGLQPRPSQDRQ